MDEDLVRVSPSLSLCGNRVVTDEQGRQFPEDIGRAFVHEGRAMLMRFADCAPNVAAWVPTAPARRCHSLSSALDPTSS